MLMAVDQTDRVLERTFSPYILNLLPYCLPLDTVVDNPAMSMHFTSLATTLANYGSKITPIYHIHEYHAIDTLLQLLRFVRTATIHENTCLL